MNAIIKVKNAEYSEYEDLLFMKGELLKESHILKGQYMAEFGDLITETFKKKVECIKKKKMIAFYQTFANKGEVVDKNLMQVYLLQEMKEYKKKLTDMIAENKAAHQMETISSDTLTKIKKLYYKLAKMIHPDINPKTSEISQLQNLWQMIVASYNSNSLKELQEAEILVNKVLADNGINDVEIEIPDIVKKIKQVQDEILQIKSNNPYQYKYLLVDEEAVAKKKSELQKELEHFTIYEKELEQLLKQMMKEGDPFIWRMN